MSAQVRLKREKLAPFCSGCGGHDFVILGFAEIKILICLLAAQRSLDMYAIERVTGVSIRMVRRTVRERVPWLFYYLAPSRAATGAGFRSLVHLSRQGEIVARAQLEWSPPEAVEPAELAAAQ